MSDPGAFSADLWKTHGPNWIKWLAHLVGKPGIHGLELGTWKGESAEWMLTNVFTAEDSAYFCVDTFEGSDEHRKLGMDCTTLEEQTRARLARFDGRVDVVKDQSHLAMKSMELCGMPFDFIYVDAAHDAMNVLRDSVLAFELLRPGGTMIWDDYAWTSMEHRLDRPKMGIDAFLGCYTRRLDVIATGWQVCARKIE